ncbi:hypothetical protein ES705_11429 [subsurface metagenome]
MRDCRQNLFEKFSFMVIITERSGQIVVGIRLCGSATGARSEPQSRSGGRGPAPCTCICFHVTAGQGVSRWLSVPAYFSMSAMPEPALGHKAQNFGEGRFCLVKCPSPFFFRRF